MGPQTVGYPIQFVSALTEGADEAAGLEAVARQARRRVCHRGVHAAELEGADGAPGDEYGRHPHDLNHVGVGERTGQANRRRGRDGSSLDHLRVGGWAGDRGMRDWTTGRGDAS